MKHLRDGIGDFLKRYRAVFGAAWKARREMDPPARG